MICATEAIYCQQLLSSLHYYILDTLHCGYQDYNYFKYKIMIE